MHRHARVRLRGGAGLVQCKFPIYFSQAFLINTSNITGPESELSGIASFTIEAAEALIDLYRGGGAIAPNTFQDNPPNTAIRYPVLVEDVDDVDCALAVFRSLSKLTCLIKICPIVDLVCLLMLLICWKKLRLRICMIMLRTVSVANFFAFHN